MHDMIVRLEAMLAKGQETSLARMTVGKAYLEAEQPDIARTHLLRATELHPEFSVAWKFLGKAELALGHPTAARVAWERGLACAQAMGDAQVTKELGVFLRRLDKADAAPGA